MGEELHAGAAIAGRFLVERVLARGDGFVLYEATDAPSGREAAVAVGAGPPAAAGPEAGVSHPSLLEVFDAGALPDGRPFVAVERVEGVRLDVWAAGHGRLSMGEALEILRPVCRAVGAYHEAGLAHGAVAPAAVVLARDPSAPGRVRVAPPALARVVAAGAARGPEAESVAGDVRALASMFYTLVTGRMWRPDSAPPPSMVDPALGPLDAPLLRGLDDAPGGRQRDAGELLGELEAAALARGGAAAPAPAPGPRASVLVVDDDQAVLRALEMTLVRGGYDVTLAADGVDALMLLGSRFFDLIVLDLAMPNLGGEQLMDLLAKKGLAVRVIVLTGSKDDELEARSIGLGAADYLRKPVSPAILRARVAAALRRT